MSTYTVVGPCAYVKDGRVVRLRRLGAKVELDDDTAAKLGGAVKKASAPLSAPAAPPSVPVAAEAAPTPQEPPQVQ